jgi:hypothetical protein
MTTQLNKKNSQFLLLKNQPNLYLNNNPHKKASNKKKNGTVKSILMIKLLEAHLPKRILISISKSRRINL